MTIGRPFSSREMLQCLRRLPNSFQLLETISRIVTAYTSDAEPWVIGNSGGKDSTAGRPRALRAEVVAQLYASASGECPTIREVNGAPSLKRAEAAKAQRAVRKSARKKAAALKGRW